MAPTLFHPHNDLAEILALQKPDQGARCIFQTIDDIFAISDFTGAEPLIHILEEGPFLI